MFQASVRLATLKRRPRTAGEYSEISSWSNWPLIPIPKNTSVVVVSLFRVDGSLECELLAPDALRLINRGLVEIVSPTAIQRRGRQEKPEPRHMRQMPRPRKLHYRQQLNDTLTCWALRQPNGQVLSVDREKR